jgi:YfiR/HmsC-like
VPRAIIIIAIQLVASGSVLSQKKPPTNEDEVKAVFLFNFAQFVEWPPEVFHALDSPVVIGILGRDPFGVYLEKTIEDEVVNGHPLVVERYSSVKQIQNCHILFINPGRTVKIESVLRALKDRNILTVSDADDFTNRGGMIRFINEDNKIKLEINLNAVKAANISISSKLLQLSEIVD